MNRMITEDFLLECKDRVEEAANRLTSDLIKAMTGGILDKKSVKQIEQYL